MKIYFYLFIILASHNSAFSQNRKIDSLNSIINSSAESSVKIATYNQLSWEYLLISEYDKSIFNAEHSLKLNSNFRKELSKSYNQLANAYSAKGNLDESLKYHFKALVINEKLKQNDGIISSYIGIGNIYFSLNNQSSAEEYYTKAFNISEKINNTKSKATALACLGNIYYLGGNISKAEEYYNRALTLESEINNQLNIGILYNNLGNIYFDKDYQTAKNYYQKAIDIREKIKDNRGLADSYYNISLIYSLIKNKEKAIYYLTQSQRLAIEIDSKESLMNCYLGFTDLYEENGDPKKALEFHKKYTSIKDSVINIESSKNMNKLNTLYETEKKNKTILLLNKEKEKQFLLTQSDRQKNRIVIYSIATVLIIVMVFSFWLYKKYILTSKQKSIIESQKFEVEKQKKLIDEKQQEIADSINYAKRIQNSFIASNSLLKNNLSDFFVLFQPKDIVSGDFYWANNFNDKFYLCVADSTGHGIPGAFMSLLNISLLNEALLSKGLVHTNELLNFVRKILILGLQIDESGQGGNDGMDCSLIAISREKNKLEFTGANNPIWILRNNAIIEINADKMPVGRSPLQDQTFSRQEVDVFKDDTIYLFTDGYPDQFGGPKGKKYKYKQLKELLISIYSMPMESQMEKVKDSFESWKGTLEQVDDVCIIGIKI